MDGKVSIENISWGNVVAPLVVAVLVGVSASYVTTRVQIGTIQQRISRAEEDITRLRTSQKTRETNAREMRERVIRMETKIDLLLQSEGISTDDISQSP